MRVGAVRRSFAQATLGACILAALLGGTARADTAAFIYTGDDQTFTVPAGVTTIHVIAVGGHGGAGTPGGFAAGAGGEAASVECDLSVTPGRILYVEVAGVGGYGNGVGGGVAGFNGGGNGHAGGGGGGASDIRTSPRSMGLTPDTRLLVAAGGGGGGEGGSQSVGGNGGAEAAGGWFDSAEKNFGGSSGDSGGVGGGSNAGMEYDGSYGQRGTGGAGGDWNRDGGGGGGGLFGGGGGAGGTIYGGGGGGGGSSLVPAGGSKVRADPAATPQILITFTPSSSSSSSPSSGGGTTTVPGVTPLSQLTPQNNFRILTPTVNSRGKILLVLNAPGPGIFNAVAVTTVPASAQRVTVAARQKRPKRITYGKRSAIADAAGAIQLSISPSKAAKKALKRVKKLKVAVTITFRPVGATPATKKVNVTVKGKKKRR